MHLIDGAFLSWIDPGKADELLREPPHVFRDKPIGNLRMKVAALEPQDDRLIDHPALSPVMLGIGGGGIVPPRRPVGGNARQPLAAANCGVARIQLSELVSGFPNVRVTIDDHKDDSNAWADNC